MDRLPGKWPVLALIWIAGTLCFAHAQERSREERRVPLSDDGGATVNPAILAQVEDNTIGLTANDREAYFKILKLTQVVDPQDLRLFAREFREDRHKSSPRYRRRPVEKFPVFVDLFQHPDVYRGHPVTLHGYFRRLVAYDPGENSQGIDQVYEGWLYADDAQSNPAVVIFTEKPEGLPIGGDLTEEVSVTGYFLKMYGYQAQDAARKAPLILAQTVHWRPEREISAWKRSPQTYMLLTAVIVVVSLAIGIGVRESQRDRQRERMLRESKYSQFQMPDDLAGDHSVTKNVNGTPIEPHH